MLLKDKKLVIIGGTSGIGLSAARVFVAAGARVAIVGNIKNDILPVQHELGTNAVVMFGEPTKPDCAKKAIERCILHFDGFDGLLHAAGGSGRKMGDGPLHEMSLEGWFKTIDLNLTSTMYANQAAIRQFLAQAAATGATTGGTILNISSMLSFSPSPKFFSTHAYSAAKAGIENFSKSVAAFYSTDNIRVNVLAPALAETPTAHRASQHAEIMDFLRKHRDGSPEDLAGLALYFMSSESAAVSGQLVAVDGDWRGRD